MIYVFTFILAFCSLVYELLLGQSLSAFLGNTVLRYCVTIGLYMLSMGIGSLFAEGRLTRDPLLTLLRVEVLLTLTGGFSVVLLHCLNWLGFPAPGFSVMAHLLIIVIGVLTGFEIPLLIEVRNLERAGADNVVLGVDYIGAFTGAVVFAFLFYPHLGLVPTAFLMGLLNAVVGVGLYVRAGRADGKPGGYRVALALQCGLLLTMLGCLAVARPIDEYFIRRYLGM